MGKACRGGAVNGQWSIVNGRRRPNADGVWHLNIVAPWAAGLGSPSASPYGVGVWGSPWKCGNGVVGKSVSRAVVIDIRSQPGDPSMKPVVSPPPTLTP